MIRFLSINNLSVVERLELEIGPGLSVLTGETGAGKSVIVGALNLLVGGRSTSELIRSGKDRAQVQAIIEDEAGGETLVRRELVSGGRGKVFIDDSLSTVGALQQLGRRMVDLHGQHEHQELLNPSSHIVLLDAYSTGKNIQRNVEASYQKWKSIRSRLDWSRQSIKDKTERRELLSFQGSEIDSVGPEVGEDEVLSIRRSRLVNADRLAVLSGEAYAVLYEQDEAIISTLGQVWQKIEELSALDSSFKPWLDSRGSVTSQLEELAFFLRSYGSQIQSSYDELSAVEERLSSLEDIKRRYGPSLEDVIARRAEIEEEFEGLVVAEQELETLVVEEEAARLLFMAEAAELSALRREDGVRLSGQLVKVLRELAIPQAQFEVRFSEIESSESGWTSKGMDSVEFYFSANKGEVLRSLSKVASGGELSRVMLGLKTLATTDIAGKTLVFDEVDAGIGGEVADRVGWLLSELAEESQVICVTHLPQIAAYAGSHYRVIKSTERDRTVARIGKLSESERVDELARLMTGTDTEIARASAAELLEGKGKAKGERRKGLIGE